MKPLPTKMINDEISDEDTPLDNDASVHLGIFNLALRRRAEAKLEEKSLALTKSIGELSDESSTLVSADAMRQKMYELQVHQIELQMQNEELRRTQFELDSARARYFDLYDLAPVGYCTLNAAGLILEANLTASALFGCARREVIGKPISRFIAKDAQDSYYHQRNQLLEHHAPVSFDLAMRKTDGTPFWALLTATLDPPTDLPTLATNLATNVASNVAMNLAINLAHSDTPGESPQPSDTPEIRQIRLVLHDISARRSADADIQEQQARYRNLFVAIDEGFCIIDVIFDAEQKAIDYRFLEVNPAFEKHTGLVGAVGKRIRELTPDVEEFWVNLYGNVARTGAAVRVVHEAKSLNRWFEAHASRHESVRQRGGASARGDSPSNHSVAIIFNDITARKLGEARWIALDKALQEKNASLEFAITRAEQASHVAEKASQVAEKASQAKSAFLSSMSHELRTPLNAILGFAQMLEIGTPPPTILQKRNIDQILKAGWYLLELINEVLDLSMIESGKVLLSREPVALADLLLECRAMIEPQAQKRGITLNFPTLQRGFFVSADRIRFKQVLLNLLINAIKYNRPNGTVSIECEAATDKVRIGVRDTGAGMAPEQIAHLFQPFNRLGREGGAEEGTGIGLVVTKRLVELMDGSIGVESQVDVGSIFWLELHLSCAQPEKVAPPVQPVNSSDIQREHTNAVRTLLYVEDNLANLELVEQLVAMRPDLRLLSATDGSVGVEFARNLQPEVILMDINLPGISGIQALQILQRDPSTQHIPVIALSANAMPGDIEQGLQLGFFHYLTKPIRVRNFMQTLDDALAFAARTATGAHIGAHTD